MNYIGKFISNFKEFYNEINSATLTGAIDVIVVEQEDGTYLCSPFHVRFGKIGVLRSKEKIVDIEINGEPVDIHMKLGDTGEAFFIEEIEDDECPVPHHLTTSPLPDESSPQYLSEQISKLKLEDNNNISSTETLTNNINTKQKNINEQKNETICDKNESTAFRDETSLSSVPKSSSVPTDFLVPNDVNEEHLRFSLTPPINKNECIPNHFVPINDKRLESTIATQTDENSKEFNGIPISTPNSQQKRIRRKKKSSVIRKQSQQKLKVKENAEQTIENNQVVKDEDIFKMDDDLESDSISDKFSSSVPILDDLSPTKSQPLNQHSTSFHDFHPYSDSETTEPFLSPNQKSYNRQSSRTTSGPDYKSDTEYEIQKYDATSQTDVEPKVSWQWGELPVVPRNTSADVNLSITSPTIKNDEIVSSDDEIEPQSKQNNKNSMLGGVLNFMKPNKNDVISNVNEDKGIYLDELNPNNINPEVAALYFPKFRSHYPLKRNVDDDSESGNGPSLPHSPQSLEVLPSSGPQSIDSGDSDQERSALCTSYDLYAMNKTYHDLSMSLCGGLEELHRDSVNSERFLHSIISFDDFSENPTLILQNPNLVIRMGGKYYNWQTAAPIIISILMFQRQLPEKTLVSLNDQFMPKKEDKKQLESNTRSSWWSWRRSNTVSGTNNKLSSNLETPSPTEDQSVMTNSSSSTTLVQSDSFTDKLNEPIDSVNSINEDNSNLSSASDAEENPDEKRLLTNGQILKKKTKYRKKLRLSSDEIKNLNLHEGSNEVLFSVTTAYQGTTTCKCHIYLWRYDDCIIISDIDGTITKSDVLGHILPIIGKDWAQSGVANLFTKIKSNGYKFLYLSARAIGQARVTREYLKSIRQGDICLPDGPLLLSPTSLMSALHREVIEKKPEEFKISCLKDIQALFPRSPFYAGFGNKINDTWAYRAVDIHLSRIFTINHKGELKLELIQTFQSSYTRLSDVVDQMFPPLREDREKGYISEFNSFEYWRDCIPEIKDSDQLTNAQNNEINVKKKTDLMRRQTSK